MGINEQFTTTTAWDQASALLDQTFPLDQGSHRDVAAYIVYFEHVMAIRHDGATTCLANSKQFVEARGSDDCPETVVLAEHGLQVEIAPRRANCRKALESSHQMHLATVIQST